MASVRPTLDSYQGWTLVHKCVSLYLLRDTKENPTRHASEVEIDTPLKLPQFWSTVTLTKRTR